MVDEITSNLEGFTVFNGQSTHLTADATDSDLTLSVADAAQVGAGVIEVDNELMWVTGADQSASTVTVAPYGRGYKGTVKAAHAANTQIRMSPAWPRAMVAREINNALAGVFPMLYGVSAAPAITLNGVLYQFGLPDDLERVVDVRYKFTDFDGWRRVDAWDVDHGSPADFGSDGMLSIYSGVPAGSTVHVLYAHRPKPLTSGTDDFTATGLPDQCRDVIVLSTMARMARFMDAARIPLRDSLNEPRGAGTATDIANDLFRQYQTRVLEEQAALSNRWPARAHKVR